MCCAGTSEITRNPFPFWVRSFFIEKMIKTIPVQFEAETFHSTFAGHKLASRPLAPRLSCELQSLQYLIIAFPLHVKLRQCEHGIAHPTVRQHRDSIKVMNSSF